MRSLFFTEYKILLMVSNDTSDIKIRVLNAQFTFNDRESTEYPSLTMLEVTYYCVLELLIIVLISEKNALKIMRNILYSLAELQGRNLA